MAEFELRNERWREFECEIEPLARAHYWGLYKDRMAPPFAIDYHSFRTLDLAGGLLASTVREDGELQGYCLWFLGPNLLSAGRLVAHLGPWFANKQGLELLRFSLQGLRDAGVSQCFPHRYVESDQRLDKVFERMGARPLEFVWELSLGED
jgi:hypothetical protein